jgi:WD40 repeat protein
MASNSTLPGVASKKSILKPIMTLEGHESSSKPPGSVYHNICISYFPNGEQMISGSVDKTARRWDLQTGKEFEETRYICEQEVWAVRVSRDGRWIVTAGGDDFGHPGELKVWEVETRIVRTLEGHSRSGHIHCIDISADSTLLASAEGWNDTVRVWSLDTGELVFEIITADGMSAVRFSQDSKKLAVNSCVAKCLQVWDIETQKLVVRRGGPAGGIVTHGSVFWTTKDKTIVATHNFKYDDYNMVTTNAQRNNYDEPKTIYEFDASTLQTVGAPFEGHASRIECLALSFDGAILASACYHTIKLWAFESRQLLTSFRVDVYNFDHLIFSPNSHQLAYTTWGANTIYICNTPPHVLATIQSTQKAQPNISAATNPRLLDSNAARRAVHHNPIQIPIVPRPQRDLYPQERAFLRYLRNLKMLPSRVTPVRIDQPRDPLDFPATLPLPRSFSPSVQATSQAHSNMYPQENARSIPLDTQSSATARTTFKARLHHLSTWWPARAGHALSPIVDVPLAPGKLRYATAGAPTFDDDLIRDEDYAPSTPPSPHPNLQQPSTGVQVTTGQHGSGRLCGCF